MSHKLFGKTITDAQWAAWLAYLPPADRQQAIDADTRAQIAQEVVSNTIKAPTAPAGLIPGGKLLIKSQLRSSKGLATLDFQSDGNIVLLDHRSPGLGKPMWSTKTNNRDCQVLVMQSDGNLVGLSSQGHPAWASNTNGHPGGWLALQDDGNLVMYQNIGGQTKPYWSSNTYGFTGHGGINVNVDLSGVGTFLHNIGPVAKIVAMVGGTIGGAVIGDPQLGTQIVSGVDVVANLTYNSAPGSNLEQKLAGIAGSASTAIGFSPEIQDSIDKVNSVVKNLGVGNLTVAGSALAASLAGSIPYAPSVLNALALGQDPLGAAIADLQIPGLSALQKINIFNAATNFGKVSVVGLVPPPGAAYVNGAIDVSTLAPTQRLTAIASVHPLIAAHVATPSLATQTLKATVVTHIKKNWWEIGGAAGGAAAGLAIAGPVGAIAGGVFGWVGTMIARKPSHV